MRIEATHFIEVWKWGSRKYTDMNGFPFPIDEFDPINEVYCKTIAIFLIREKTPPEKAAWGSRVKELTEQHLSNQ